MTPDIGFVIAGLLFLIAMIAGLGLLLLAAAVALSAGGAILVDELCPPTHEPDPAAVLGQLLVDLAEHHQHRAGWPAHVTDGPPVIEVTAVDRTRSRAPTNR
ncbi:MAG: hypothetical protein ACRDZO_23130 [Egibacteraceae bacterium]